MPSVLKGRNVEMNAVRPKLLLTSQLMNNTGTEIWMHLSRNSEKTLILAQALES